MSWSAGVILSFLCYKTDRILVPESANILLLKKREVKPGFWETDSGISENENDIYAVNAHFCVYNIMVRFKLLPG